MTIPIAIAYGDGIGPEITEATVRVLKGVEADITMRSVEIGGKAYAKFWKNGIPESVWKELEDTAAMIKAPITTPYGGGYGSLNVAIRKKMKLYANIRPAKSMHPFVFSRFPKMDLITVRENEECLYSGVEYTLDEGFHQCSRIITKKNSDRIAKYAFDLAQSLGRKKITCMVKDNIMKITDGCFSRSFFSTAESYPQIDAEKMIIDIGSAKLAVNPESFDVILAPNLYGDILSDIAAEVSGSIGMAGSANVGDNYAMFEAVHGSAPDIAGKGIANPSGLINAAAMMLDHINQPEKASALRNAWMSVLEEGIHTIDMKSDRTSLVVGTLEFGEAVASAIGKKPRILKAETSTSKMSIADKILEEKNMQQESSTLKKIALGADFTFVRQGMSYADLAEKAASVTNSEVKVIVVMSKGSKAWPSDIPFDDGSSCATVRISAPSPGEEIDVAAVLRFAEKMRQIGFDPLSFEMLFSYDNNPGFFAAGSEF